MVSQKVHIEFLIKLWQQEHGVKVFDNRKLRGICGSKGK
jgi:hypothetical protein